MERNWEVENHPVSLSGQEMVLEIPQFRHQNSLFAPVSSSCAGADRQVVIAFMDKDEKTEVLGSEWDYTFSAQNGKLTEGITINYESLAYMEAMFEMSIKVGSLCA